MYDLNQIPLLKPQEKWGGGSPPSWPRAGVLAPESGQSGDVQEVSGSDPRVPAAWTQHWAAPPPTPLSGPVPGANTEATEVTP